MVRKGAFLAGLAAMAACNALTGAGDLQIGELEDASVSDSATAPSEDVSQPVEAGPADATVDTNIDAGSDAGLPSYCAGATIYVKFDGNAASADGAQPVAAVTAPYVAGKFGQALNVNGTTTVYYAATVAGLPKRADAAVGTMMLWFRGTWAFPGTATRTFIRTKDNTDNSVGFNGPAIDLSPARFGAVVPNVIQAALDPAVIASEWTVGGWNHIAATWTTTGTPNMSFVLNGGDAAGGKTAQTTAAWAPPLPANFIRIGSAATPIDGFVDDVVVWTRALSQAEIAAIYAQGIAGRSFGAVCNK